MFQLHILDREVKKAFEELQMTYVNDKTVATHGWIIAYLCEHTELEIYQKDLERKFHMAPSTMTMILQSMERAGLIQRVSACHDARLKQIALTPEGIRYNENAMKNFEIIGKRMIEGIAPEELETCRRVFRQMIENLKDPKDERRTE